MLAVFLKNSAITSGSGNTDVARTGSINLIRHIVVSTRGSTDAKTEPSCSLVHAVVLLFVQLLRGYIIYLYFLKLNFPMVCLRYSSEWGTIRFYCSRSELSKPS